MEPIINYYVAKKVVTHSNVWMFQPDGIGVYKTDKIAVRQKIVKKFRIMPAELQNFQFLMGLLQRQDCGPGVYKICPLYQHRRGIFKPILGVKLNTNLAEIYEPVLGQFEKWTHARNIRL